MTTIEEEHRLNKEFLEKNNLQVGSRIKWRDRFGEIHDTTINWINPFYFWFGDEKHWILRENVIMED